MVTWLIVLVTLFVSALLKSLFSSKLPPGPTYIPIIGPFLFGLSIRYFSDVEPILRNLVSKYGPIVTLHVGHRPDVYIRDRFLAHRTLVQNGAVFASRPPSLPTAKVFSSNDRSINTAPYGATWRLLRRNLTAEILHPSRLGSYSRARKRVLDVLLARLRPSAVPGDPVRVIDDLHYAMYCLLVFMCFGDKVDEKKIEEIESIQRQLLVRFSRFNVLDLLPRLGKVIFRRQWSELYEFRQRQHEVFAPLIKAAKVMKLEKARKAAEEKGTAGGGGDGFVLSYVDTLLDLELPDEKRKLSEEEIGTVCSEFLTAGTDTTSTALQWIMANLVKYPEIQDKLFASIKEAMADSAAEEVREEDLQKMGYLKAVVLEGLRRHPPTHLVLPHAVTEDATVEGYLVPKKGTVNFMAAEMGWDPEVWEEPMAFRPERFMSADGKRVEAFDVTGSKEIKMMPFGVGRRSCPGYVLALLHLEYFVANLVWNFKWTAVAGDDVDLSEKEEFTVVMKNPLKAQISERSK